MPIYDRPVKQLMRDFAADHLIGGRTFKKSEAVDWFQERYPKVKASTIKAHVEAMAVNAFGWRKNDPALRPGGGYDFFFKVAPGTFRLWIPEQDPPPIYHDDVRAAEASDAGQNRSALVSKIDISVRARRSRVDMSIAREIGSGSEIVYAYGYNTAPGYLKVGRCEGDVARRVSSQIDTGTPGQPTLHLVIRTDHSKNLEKALHRVLQVRNRRLDGGGEEWFQTNVEELIQVYQFCVVDWSV